MTYNKLRSLFNTDTRDNVLGAMVAYGWSIREAEYAYNNREAERNATGQPLGPYRG